MKINQRDCLEASCSLPNKELTDIYLVPTSTGKKLPVNIVMHCTQKCFLCSGWIVTHGNVRDFYPDSSSLNLLHINKINYTQIKSHGEKMPWQKHQLLSLHPSLFAHFYHVSNVTKIYFCIPAFLALDHHLFSVAGALKIKNLFLPLKRAVQK